MNAMRKHKWRKTVVGGRGLLCAGMLLAISSLTACNSFAPTAWIGSDTPDDVGKGEFPKLSDMPERPILPDSAQDRDRMAADMAAERDRVARMAHTLREEGDIAEDGELGETP